MKNFKKVISTVIALAISASTLVAVSASKFSDVADTASYAEAIEVLTALGAISGYEDGTFQPEKEITRAEASTLIVGALNMKADAQAAAGSTQFVDVNESASWASGYINVGVSEGYINGRSETQFDPQANVTYAEMCVMLTKITKYADYAESSKKDGDPWYKCYTDMAASIGLNKGANVPLTSAVTRGTVAQMIYNAITTPILGVDKYIYAGNEYAPMDGTNGSGEFRTPLADSFGGYVVTAKVTDTAVAGGLDNDKAKIDIVKADYWNKQPKIVETNPVKGVNVTLKDVNVNDYYNQTGKAVILVDDSDENHMIYFKADSRTEKKIVSAEDYMMQIARGSKSYDSASAGSRTIRFGSTEVKVEDPANLKLYVNGKQFGSTPVVTDKVLDKFLGNAQGDITFVNTDDKTYKRFDAIFVTYYEIGQVASVTYRSGKTTVVLDTVKDLYNDTTYAMTSAEIEIKDEDVEEGDTVVTVKKNGAEIELKDLAEDDIVAFATDFNGQYPAGKFGKTSTIKTIDIIATDETISGMVVDYDDEAGTYTIGDKAYKFVGYDYANNDDLDITKTYDLELDPFGRIYDAGKQVGAIEKFAILEDIVGTDAILVLPDGSRSTYEIDKNNTTWTDNTNFKTIQPYDRVISYKVKNDEITFSVKAYDGTLSNDTYSARLNKIAGIELTEKVNIIDASKYVAAASKSISDYAKFDASNFVAETKYTGYTYEVGQFTSFIILTDTGYTLTEESRFAVLTENVGTKFLNDESVYGAKALYNGEETTLYWETAAEAAGLTAGDAIFFVEDGDGYIKEQYLVYDVAVNTSNFANSTYAFKNITTLTTPHTPLASTEYDNTLWNLDGSLPVPAGKDAALVAGVVMESDSDQVLFGIPNAGVIDMAKRNQAGGYADFDLADDCAIYTFTKSDANLLAKERFNIATGAQIGDSSTYFTKVTGQEDQYNYSAANEIAAVALVIDKEIVCIYAIN